MSASAGQLGADAFADHRDGRAGRRVETRRYSRRVGERVHRELVALWESPFGCHAADEVRMAEPLAFDERTGELQVAHIDGHPLGGSDDVTAFEFVLPEVAALVAELHRSGVTVRERHPAPRIVRSLVRASRAPRARLGPAGRPAVTRLAAIAPIGEQLVPSHGGLSPRRVLVTGDGLAVLGLDGLRMAGRGHDIAAIGAWAWTAMLRDGDAADWSIGEQFAEAYSTAVGSSAWRRHEPFHRAAALLRTVLGPRPEPLPEALAHAVVAEAARIAGPGRP